MDRKTGISKVISALSEDPKDTVLGIVKITLAHKVRSHIWTWHEETAWSRAPGPVMRTRGDVAK